MHHAKATIDGTEDRRNADCRLTPPAPYFPAEVRLLLLLCRHPAQGSNRDLAAGLCAEVRDWRLFLLLARHHRVMPLIAKNATGNAAAIPLPAGIYAELNAYASANAIEAFRSLAETGRLLGVLANSGVEASVLKGVPLSLQAFGDVATRDVGDIDLMVRPEDAEATDHALREQHFQRRQPVGELTPRRRASYADHFKDYTYEPPNMQTDGGFEVDLHWRLFRNLHMPGNRLNNLTPEIVAVGTLRLRTLPPLAQLLYLAVQGAVDGWTRFKAVADVAALWNGIGDAAGVLSLADANGVTPYLQAALLLADSWIGGLDLPAEYSTAASALAARIVQRAQRKLLATEYFPALRESSSWAMKRYEASLCGTVAYKWELARRVLLRPRVWDRFDLPDVLFPLYPLLSPVEWLLFRLRRGGREGAS